MSEVPFFDGKEGQDDRIILEEAMQLLEELHERSLHETTEDEAIIAKTEGQLPPKFAASLAFLSTRSQSANKNALGKREKRQCNTEFEQLEENF